MSKFKFDLVLSNFKRNEIPLAKQIAAHSVKYWMQMFKSQRWLSKSWKEVNRRIPGTPEYKYPKKRGLARRRKPILVGTGALRRALNSSVKKVTSKGIQYQIDLPYAQVHNEGLPMKNGRKMPKRQFMGYTRELNTQIQQIIKKNIDKNFKTS